MAQLKTKLRFKNDVVTKMIFFTKWIKGNSLSSNQHVHDPTARRHENGPAECAERSNIWFFNCYLILIFNFMF